MLPNGCWPISNVTFFFQAGVQFISALKSLFSSALNCPAPWCPKTQLVSSVCDTSAWYPREFRGIFSIFIYLLVHGAVFMPCVDGLCTVFNGKSTTLPTFSQQVNLLKAAWCHSGKKKNVLFLLPLGLPQEFLHLRMTRFPALHLPHDPEPHALKADEKGKPEKVRGVETQEACVSHLGRTLCREDLHPRSRVLSIVVSSCCHSRSSSPSQGRSCLSRKCLRLSSWWSLVPSEFCEDGGRNSQEDSLSPFFLGSPFRCGYCSLGLLESRSGIRFNNWSKTTHL